MTHQARLTYVMSIHFVHLRKNILILSLKPFVLCHTLKWKGHKRSLLSDGSGSGISTQNNKTSLWLCPYVYQFLSRNKIRWKNEGKLCSTQLVCSIALVGFQTLNPDIRVPSHHYPFWWLWAGRHVVNYECRQIHSCWPAIRCKSQSYYYILLLMLTR